MLIAYLLQKLWWKRYYRAFAIAEQQDIAYYRTHPGCSVAEAHLNRDRVNRKYHLD